MKRAQPDPDVATGGQALLHAGAVRLSESAIDRFDAVRRCGAVLLETGAVGPPYVDAMLTREQMLSTYVGVGVALPHGTTAGRHAVFRDALAVVRFPDGVDWDGDHVTVCVAVAAAENRHMDMLAGLAGILLDPIRAEVLRKTTDPALVIQLFESGCRPHCAGQ